MQKHGMNFAFLACGWCEVILHDLALWIGVHSMLADIQALRFLLCRNSKNAGCLQNAEKH